MILTFHSETPLEGHSSRMLSIPRHLLKVTVLECVAPTWRIQGLVKQRTVGVCRTGLIPNPCTQGPGDPSLVTETVPRTGIPEAFAGPSFESLPLKMLSLLQSIALDGPSPNVGLQVATALEGLRVSAAFAKQC